MRTKEVARIRCPGIMTWAENLGKPRGSDPDSENSEEEEGSETEGEVEVDRIMAKRVVTKIEYQIKRKGGRNGDSEWIGEDKLDSKGLELAEKFDRRLKDSEEEDGQVAGGSGGSGRKRARVEPKEDIPTAPDAPEGSTPPNGFDLGLTADKIMEARGGPTGQFLMQWKEETSVETWVPAKVANVKCPSVVIEYYEELYSS